MNDINVGLSGGFLYSMALERGVGASRGQGSL